MNPLFLQLNLGVGDMVYARCFLNPVKHHFSRISITLAQDAIQFWFAGDPVRWKFDCDLARLVFNEPPYDFVENPSFRYQFFPNDRIAKELNTKSTNPNLLHLAQGTSLNIGPYIVLSTKCRQFSEITFNTYKKELVPVLQALTKKFKVVILGEREVQKTKEYTNSVNIGQVFGAYDFYKETLKDCENVVDLTIPSLGINVSSIEQFRQDCLIMKEAEAVINMGIGGNYWMAIAVAKQIINLRTDNEWTTDLMSTYPGLIMSKNIKHFTATLEQLKTAN